MLNHQARSCGWGLLLRHILGAYVTIRLIPETELHRKLKLCVGVFQE